MDATLKWRRRLASSRSAALHPLRPQLSSYRDLVFKIRDHKVGGAFMRRRVSPWQAVAVAVLSVLTVLYLFPFYWMVVTALKPLVEFYQFPPTLLPVHATVGPFLSVLFARGYLVLLRNSLVACLTAVAAGIVVAMLIAYPVTRLPVSPAFRRGRMRWILILRFVSPGVVVMPLFDSAPRLVVYGCWL